MICIESFPDDRHTSVEGALYRILRMMIKSNADLNLDMLNSYPTNYLVKFLKAVGKTSNQNIACACWGVLSKMEEQDPTYQVKAVLLLIFFRFLLELIKLGWMVGKNHECQEKMASLLKSHSREVKLFLYFDNIF